MLQITKFFSGSNAPFLALRLVPNSILCTIHTSQLTRTTLDGNPPKNDNYIVLGLHGSTLNYIVLGLHSSTLNYTIKYPIEVGTFAMRCEFV